MDGAVANPASAGDGVEKVFVIRGIAVFVSPAAYGIFAAVHGKTESVRAVGDAAAENALVVVVFIVGRRAACASRRLLKHDDRREVGRSREWIRRGRHQESRHVGSAPRKPDARMSVEGAGHDFRIQDDVRPRGRSEETCIRRHLRNDTARLISP